VFQRKQTHVERLTQLNPKVKNLLRGYKIRPININHTKRVTYRRKQIKLHYITQYTNHTYYIEVTYIVLCSTLHTYHL